MRRDLYAAIRSNLCHHNPAIARAHAIEVLADVLAGQVQVIRDDAINKRIP